MDYISAYFRQIVIFIIFMTFIEILIPDKKYKKYIDFVLGLMLISVMVSPISNIFNINASEFNLEIPYYDNEFTYQDKNYTKQLYENELSSQISKKIDTQFSVKSFVTVNVSDDLQAIEKISVNYQNDFIHIEPIIIGEEKESNVESKEIMEIKTFISNEYSVPLNNIYINITS